MMPSRGLWVAWAAILFASILAQAAPIPDNGGAYRYRFKVGDKVKYTLEEKSVIEMSTSGGTTKISANTTFDFAWRATKVADDGKLTLVQTIERVRIEAETPQGKLGYDTKAPPIMDDVQIKGMAEAFNVFLGGEMTLTLDARGRIESLKYSEKLAKDITMLSPAAAGITAALSEESLRRPVGQCLPVFPNKAVDKGQSWESKLEAKFMGAVNFTLDNKHTYEGTVTRSGRKVEKIVTKPTLSVSVDPDMGTIKVLDQDVSSTSYFDKTTGCIVEAAFSQKVELEMSQKGQTVKLKGKTESTLKLADKEK